MMKIIFLDIDGVLNSISDGFGIPHNMTPSTLDRRAIGMLKYVTKVTKSHIVISSTWRCFGTHEWFCGLFEAYGWFRPPIIDITRGSKKDEIRGDEVNDYLNRHVIDKYVIIDDDSDFYPDQKLVQTDIANGFILKNALECIDILGNELEKEEKSIKDLKLYVK